MTMAETEVGAEAEAEAVVVAVPVPGQISNLLRSTAQEIPPTPGYPPS